MMNDEKKNNEENRKEDGVLCQRADYVFVCR